MGEVISAKDPERYLRWLDREAHFQSFEIKCRILECVDDLVGWSATTKGELKGLAMSSADGRYDLEWASAFESITGRELDLITSDWADYQIIPNLTKHVRLDARDLPFSDSAFDFLTERKGALGYSALESIDQSDPSILENHLAELSRVLAPSGVILLDAMDSDAYNKFARELGVTTEMSTAEVFQQFQQSFPGYCRLILDRSELSSSVVESTGTEHEFQRNFTRSLVLQKSEDK